ncbi:hypothetical protein MTF65_22710 [Streptomyces sp. APSN-46.1]|uniref:hypothetical protein n=1 Tax=Streptomyces sp. APSN-46.1 TaxID=2929049 RepID=UPI001FB54CB0|nr:hypothetical protein [Streptomyces sp. APSN-46.1]MCJ1680100.1 hypothetical protein [Streptomyces sp. APSN-46.1]
MVTSLGGTDVRTAAVAAPPALVLPLPGEPLADCRHTDCAERLSAGLAALRDTLAGRPPAGYPPPSGEADRVRHRRLTGRRAAFPVWQSLARALHGLAATPEGAADRMVARAAALYDASSVLLLYAGGAAAAHPGVCDEWARDHVPVPGALRAARDRHPGPVLDPLTRAARDHARVRVAVLPQGGRCPGRGPTEAEQARYDAHFHVERQPVCRPAYRASLAGLLARCAADIGAHGLGPLPDGCPDHLGREALARLAPVALYEEPPGPAR